MIHPERVEDHLEHSLQAIDPATRYIRPLDRAQTLHKNEQTQDAVVRNIEIIGEAARKNRDDCVTDHPEMPWTEMRGMRNKMIHQYSDVDWDIVWHTVVDELPVLRRLIACLLPGAG